MRVSRQAPVLGLSHCCPSSVTEVPAGLLVTQASERKEKRAGGRFLANPLVFWICWCQQGTSFFGVETFSERYSSVFTRKYHCPRGCPSGKLGSRVVCWACQRRRLVFESSMNSVSFTALAQRVVCRCSSAVSIPLIFLISETEITELSHLPVP